MADPMLRAALRERQKLEAELESIPAYRRLLVVNQVIETYQPKIVAGTVAPPSPLPAPDDSPASGPAEAIKRPASRAPEIIDAAFKYLTERRAFVLSGKLADELSARGIPLGNGKSTPAAYLSAYLSGTAARSRGIINRRGQGYGLAQWTVAEDGAVAELVPTFSGVTH